MKTQKRQIKFLEKKEIEQIIAAIPFTSKRDLRDRALLQVLFSTGLRIAECLNLKREDFVKWDRGTKEMPITGKGGWTRTIYFSPQALEAIHDYLVVLPVSEIELFPFTQRCAHYICKRRAVKAGIEKHVSNHTFRHSFATYILGKTGNIRLVQEMLGHRSLSNTEIYTHITSPELQDAHKKLFL